MNNITKYSVLFTHPLYGDVTINDILMLLIHITNNTKKFEKLAFNIAKHNHINDNVLSNLIHLLPSSILEELVDDFNELIH